MFGETPARHDRAAARDDAGDAVRGQRHIGEAHAGVDREIVDALLGLLDQRVLEHFPIQLQGVAADFFKRLIDRHGADRHAGVANDPVANVVDVAAGGKVHHRVGAPARRPHHFLDLFRDRGGDGGIADIGVDLDQKIAADDNGFEFGMVDVGGDDRPAAGDFAAHELRRHEFGNRRAKALAVGDAGRGLVKGALAAEIFAVRDIAHFFRDDPGAGEFELRDRARALGAQQRTRGGGARRREMLQPDKAVVLGLHLAPLVGLQPLARLEPGPRAWKTGGEVRREFRAAIGAGGIIDAQRRFARGRVERDFAVGHFEAGRVRRRGIALARAADRAGRHGHGGRGILVLRVHGHAPSRPGRCKGGGP